MLQGRFLNRPKRGGRVEADGRLLDGARGSEPEQAQGLIIGPAGQPPPGRRPAPASVRSQTPTKDITAVMAVTFRVE